MNHAGSEAERFCALFQKMSSAEGSAVVDTLLNKKTTPIIEHVIELIKNQHYKIYITQSIMKYNGHEDQMKDGKLMEIDSVMVFLGIGEYLENACIAGIQEFRNAKKKRVSINGHHMVSFEFRDETLMIEISEPRKSMTICLFEER